MKFISGIPEAHIRHVLIAAVPSAEFEEEALSLTNDFKGSYKNRLAIWRYGYEFPMEKVGVTVEFRKSKQIIIMVITFESKN